MQQDSNDDSDSDGSGYEIISLNPNIIYESEDESDVEDVKIKLEPPAQQDQPPEPVSLEENSTDLPCDDENSNDSVKKVRRKLNLQEYKMRRANEKQQEDKKPLFDLPKRVAAYELCDVPASLPMLVLPTDSDCFLMMSGAVDQSRARLDDPRCPRPVFNPDLYEEITLVSMGCNTDISISPRDDSGENKDCLRNIVKNLNKDNVESLLSSSTSLFSSIQAVVQGKCSTTAESSESINDNEQQHGEDKIIMHLRKDRLKPFKCTTGVQTDSHSLFPPLLVTPLAYNRSRNPRNYRRKISRSRSRSRSYSPIGEYERVKCQKRYTRSQHSTHSSSMNSGSSSGSSDSDSDSSSYSSSRSSADSLKQFNNRNNFRFYDRNQRDQGYHSYPEERKIVYIGGLEEDTSKDEIRKKFLNYGTIRKISLHVKEDGMRYGFVTFAEAESAYEVLEKFTKDSLISNYDIRFGGRRNFCKQSYADLDSLAVEKEYTDNQKSQKDMSFEDLLLLTKKKLMTGKK